MIDVRTVTKSYGPVEALKGVSFHVESGEIAVIAHHELTTQHLMDAAVEMTNTKVLESPNYYTRFFPDLDQVIKSYYAETLQPIINAKRASENSR